jgi:hypothetical protein
VEKFKTDGSAIVIELKNFTINYCSQIGYTPTYVVMFLYLFSDELNLTKVLLELNPTLIVIIRLMLSL